eukprot:CAMPEP_0180474458 /NCGR_PEP_ID=MMETSP1036_2-20121128/30686_1 /TAXON_ID=632150 /ORGANISM="Azadinium spinosum, Strain 3D9" /LENGTH=84 /DNA_ID=CAMNT_0022481773 /DNA_START=224 /DNA_END=475 /DNA_ORIENTATION=+
MKKPPCHHSFDLGHWRLGNSLKEGRSLSTARRRPCAGAASSTAQLPGIACHCGAGAPPNVDTAPSRVPTTIATRHPSPTRPTRA